MNLGRYILSIVALTSLSATYAQTGKEWDNPAITSVNREVSHTVALPMASEADVQQADLPPRSSELARNHHHRNRSDNPWSDFQ